MIIFNVPNFILSFVVLASGFLMLSLGVVILLISFSVIMKVIREW